jgi:peptidoglycan/xylan/chitin deacetylase (PgdA/CDA1 family)
LLSDERGTLDGAQYDCVVAPPQYPRGAILSNLARKISNRLAIHVPVGLRRLTCATPIVSFTFDDAPASAHSRGATMLEKAGGRATYYLSTALLGRRTREWTLIDRDAVADLDQRGHEIGLHTHRHRAVNLLSKEELFREIEENRAALRDISPSIDARNFAYPFGFAAFPRKLQLARLTSSSRSVRRGVNVGSIDAHYLKCVELTDSRLSPAELERFLDAVVAKNGWLIFVSHDVSPSPSPYGCSLSLLQRALDGVIARGVKIVTVADALRKGVSAQPAYAAVAAPRGDPAIGRLG